MYPIHHSVASIPTYINITTYRTQITSHYFRITSHLNHTMSRINHAHHIYMYMYITPYHFQSLFHTAPHTYHCTYITSTSNTPHPYCHITSISRYITPISRHITWYHMSISDHMSTSHISHPHRTHITTYHTHVRPHYIDSIPHRIMLHHAHHSHITTYHNHVTSNLLSRYYILFKS